MWRTPERGFAGVERPAVDEHLGEGVILREAMEAARAEQIGARIADVGDQQIPTEAPSARQRRPHAAQRRIFAPLPEDHRAGLLHDVPRATLQFGRR